MTALLAAEEKKKLRIEFVWFPDDSWGLLLAHWPWATSGWMLATDVAAYDGGRGMRSAERWAIVRGSRVPASIRAAYKRDIANWRALAQGRIRDERWYARYVRCAAVRAGGGIEPPAGRR